MSFYKILDHESCRTLVALASEQPMEGEARLKNIMLYVFSANDFVIYRGAQWEWC
jgi:hypothetical protein